MTAVDQSANEPGRGDVHIEDMGGWVHVFPDPQGAALDDLPTLLSQALAEWFRQRPHLRMVTITSATSRGNTTSLLAWYEDMDAPDLSMQRAEPKE